MDAKEAGESVAEKFTRMMNATTSPLGAYSDVGAASVVSGALVVIGFFAIRRSTDPSSIYVALAVAAFPLVASVLVSTFLTGSRPVGVDWLPSLPFPAHNLYALLAGLPDTTLVHLSSPAPSPPPP